MEIALVFVVIVVVAVGSALLARRVRHPEAASSHSDTGGDTTSDRFHTDPGRPAGPDAEDPVGPTR